MAERLGIRTGIDVLAMIDVAEDVVRPVMDGECVIDRLAADHGLRRRVLQLPEARLPGRRALRRDRAPTSCWSAAEQKLVGGQEDQIIEIAAALAGAPA